MSEYDCPICGSELKAVTDGYQCSNCGYFIGNYEVEENGII